MLYAFTETLSSRVRISSTLAFAEVAEQADASDSKSDGGNPVGVRLPPSALIHVERILLLSA